ncbi:MAG TPA: cupin domain-containing protein [Chloroflexota bacterium]|nr:cupin domain-containing protein [Chloroflexota bacterium]
MTFTIRSLPDSDALLAGRAPRDTDGFKSEHLQILYRNTDEPWSDPAEHRHEESDECFLVLQGTLVVEVEGVRHQVGPRAVCFFGRGTIHRLIEAHGHVECLIIRAPSLDDKHYSSIEDWQWPNFLL